MGLSCSLLAADWWPPIGGRRLEASVAETSGRSWGGNPGQQEKRLCAGTRTAAGGTKVFVDRVEIAVQAGRGGAGCLSFRREKYVPRGGPDGGDGGHGGSIIIVAVPGVDHLSALAHRKHWRAEPGQSGGPANRNGRNGQNLTIEVPPGTLIIDAEAGHVIKDLTGPGDQVTIARGGKAGRGNASFKTSTNRAPRTTTPGEEGEKRSLVLELKVIADVGLVGKPNAGKSTLLSRLSRARPEIADYPFTTKHPNLGIVDIDLDRSFVLADIPGLIEGAHEGAGLGHEFLRHIERAGILVHLVEPEPSDGSDPVDNYHAIRQELTQYREELGSRPEILVVSKQDLPSGQAARELLEEALKRPVQGISAATSEGLPELVRTIARTLQEQKELQEQQISREQQTPQAGPQHEGEASSQGSSQPVTSGEESAEPSQHH